MPPPNRVQHQSIHWGLPTYFIDLHCKDFICLASCAPRSPALNLFQPQEPAPVVFYFCTSCMSYAAFDARPLLNQKLFRFFNIEKTCSDISSLSPIPQLSSWVSCFSSLNSKKSSALKDELCMLRNIVTWKRVLYLGLGSQLLLLLNTCI